MAQRLSIIYMYAKYHAVADKMSAVGYNLKLTYTVIK